MLMVKIYAIINPANDEVLYIGASRTPKLRLYNHAKGKSWENLEHSHRQREILKMKEAGIKPELLILDEVAFPDVQFFEEFYMQLFKTWGYKIQQTRSGYQTNKRFFKDKEIVYLPRLGVCGIVKSQTDEFYVNVFIKQIGRCRNIFVNDVTSLNELV